MDKAIRQHTEAVNEIIEATALMKPHVESLRMAKKEIERLEKVNGQLEASCRAYGAMVERLERKNRQVEAGAAKYQATIEELKRSNENLSETANPLGPQRSPLKRLPPMRFGTPLMFTKDKAKGTPHIKIEDDTVEATTTERPLKRVKSA